MANVYDAPRIAAAVGLSLTTIWTHRRDKTCPLHGAGMRRQRTGRKFVATPETFQAYRAWLNELVPVSDSGAA